MSRWSEIGAVSILVVATAFVALVARRIDHPKAPTTTTTGAAAGAAAAVAPTNTLAGDSHNVLGAHLETLVPPLENMIVFGASNARDGSPACMAESQKRLDELDSIERSLDLDARKTWHDDATRSLVASTAEALANIRTCVRCDHEKTGCAAAARAMTRIENQLRSYDPVD